jgi:hypothetical protein
MRDSIFMSELERERYRARAVEQVRARYDWDAVATQYETLLASLRE